MKSTAKSNNTQLNTELSSEEIIKTADIIKHIILCPYIVHTDKWFYEKL